MTTAALSLERSAAATRLRPITFVTFAGGLAAAAGIVGANLALNGHALVIVGLVLIVVPLVLWRMPQVGIAVLILAAATVEQLSLPLSQFGGIGTEEIHFFTSLSDTLGMNGVLITPLELTIAVILLVWLTRAVADRRLRFPRSHLAIGLAIFFGLVLLAALRGLAVGADVRTVLRELRPWVYLSVLYLLASQVLARRGVFRLLLWAFVLGTGLKGLQGTYRFVLTANLNPRPPSILSHEDAVFFSLFVLLTAALWIFGERGRLRWAATALLPTVLLADLANGRRTAWLILLAGMAALLAVGWIRLAERRSLVGRVAVIAIVGGLVYFPLFWQSTSLIGEPARAIRSAVAPGDAERNSNLYRRYENANLMDVIRRTTPFGQGFGVQIDYSAFPGHDSADSDITERFTPHDGILFVWVVAGIPGALAFWFVIGAAFVSASRLARSPDRQMALFGTFTICALIAYVMEGYFDYGLSWFRVAVLMGCILGATEAARRVTQMPPSRASIASRAAV